MNRLTLIVLAFTVFACTKDETEPKQFTPFGVWQSEVYYDGHFADSAYEVIEYRPDSSAIRRYYGNNGFNYTQHLEGIRFEKGQIVYQLLLWNHKYPYLYLDNNTFLIQYKDWVKFERVQ